MMIYGVEGKEIVEVPKGLFPNAFAVAQRVIEAANLGEGSGLTRIRQNRIGEPPAERWNLLVVREEILRSGKVALDLYLTGRDPDAEIAEEPMGSGRFQVALHERYNGPTVENVRAALASST